MRINPAIILGVVVILIIVSGCTNNNTNSSDTRLWNETRTTEMRINESPEPTTLQTINVSNTTSSIIAPPLETPIPTRSLPRPEPTDPINPDSITFSHYSNGWYSFDYPDTWNISENDYTYFNERNQLRFGKNTTSISKNGKLGFYVNAVKYEGEDLYAYIINPDIVWCKEYLNNQFPGIGASSYLSNYHYDYRNGNGAAIYDVVFPKSLNITPAARTEKVVISNMHGTFFVFQTDTQNFEKYLLLKEYMLGTTKVNS